MKSKNISPFVLLPLEQWNINVVETIYSNYLRGMSINDIVSLMSTHHNFRVDADEVNYLIDQKNIITGLV